MRFFTVLAVVAGAVTALPQPVTEPETPANANLNKRYCNVMLVATVICTATAHTATPVMQATRGASAIAAMAELIQGRDKLQVSA
ncbi:predicted protein [Chaetomium globosum CBS 148.51]|uniref:Uncharacterized protein n=1 Tax=Chaetomium globosum (strain ATCC 6205 / CBS 148.51 / DSM 1962 / NBRC 6347 / NRRL 1970) TaxID=306901 RepID=Q2HHM7_CHAGB|nr:uncharacterized protein CHGG_00277 [Chaetomium globosum CBS 148.51]EAQ92042.1 predicted protein [Chaetomium globosum CBS 148.51]